MDQIISDFLTLDIFEQQPLAPIKISSVSINSILLVRMFQVIVGWIKVNLAKDMLKYKVYYRLQSVLLIEK